MPASAGRLQRTAMLLPLLALLLPVAFATAGEREAQRPRSTALLERGRFCVATQTLKLVDASRPTEGMDRAPSHPSRTLKTTLWYPSTPESCELFHANPQPVLDEQGPRPLVIYSHGFMSSYKEARYLTVHLASHGYIVAAPTFPLTSLGAPGKPLLVDIVNQPADLRFLLDSILAWNREEGNLFQRRIDEDRIVLLGASLGSLTSLLATYAPETGDPRIKAVATLAPPAGMLPSSFFAGSEVPLLVVAGTADGILPFEQNARVLFERANQVTLVTLHDGSHTGFSDVADPWFAWFRNPDDLSCPFIEGNLPDSRDVAEHLENRIPGADPLVIGDLPCTTEKSPRSLRPGRQQDLTLLAVTSFFEQHLAPDPTRREAMGQFLYQAFPAENAEVSVERAPLLVPVE